MRLAMIIAVTSAVLLGLTRGSGADAPPATIAVRLERTDDGLLARSAAYEARFDAGGQLHGLRVDRTEVLATLPAPTRPAPGDAGQKAFAVAGTAATVRVPGMTVTVVFRTRSVSLRIRNETRHETSYRLAPAAGLRGVDEFDARRDELGDLGPKERVVLRYADGLHVELSGGSLYVLGAANRVFVEARIAGGGERVVELKLSTTGKDSARSFGAR